MGLIKIYGRKGFLAINRQIISEAIHLSLVEAFWVLPGKKFQRFIALDEEDFICPENKSYRFISVEIVAFEGRSMEAKKRLIRLIYQRLRDALGLTGEDVQITIFEQPRENWGVDGLIGDEIELTCSAGV
ncbi:MAG: tautomerase family protein [Planctomycetes bacterium]|nr:tautomerase family protein [Planctomycetota bacterium]